MLFVTATCRAGHKVVTETHSVCGTSAPGHSFDTETSMKANTPNPVTSFLNGLDGIAAPARLRVLLRTARHKLRPPTAPVAHMPRITSRQDDLIGSGRAGLHQRADILSIAGKGPLPTIVVGGFVPDATESVFLLRDKLCKQGPLFCLNYPTSGFNLDLFLAQLDDLVEELSVLKGHEPVVFSVSFGAGLVMEWLRRRRIEGGHHAIRGLVLISPVACVEDLLPAGGAKAQTLLGRAITPYLAPRDKVDEKVVERSRTIFGKMFESGAQNKEALSGLMTRGELHRLKDRVMGTIRSISFTGACERVEALKVMHSPHSYFLPGILPLADVPTLVLYAEKEDSVLDEASPTRDALTRRPLAYFPRGRCSVVRNPGGSPVQHASLIFHQANFCPALIAFYRSLRGGWAKGRGAAA